MGGPGLTTADIYTYIYIYTYVYTNDRGRAPYTTTVRPNYELIKKNRRSQRMMPKPLALLRKPALDGPVVTCNANAVILARGHTKRFYSFASGFCV